MRLKCCYSVIGNNELLQDLVVQGDGRKAQCYQDGIANTIAIYARYKMSCDSFLAHIKKIENNEIALPLREQCGEIDLEYLDQEHIYVDLTYIDDQYEPHEMTFKLEEFKKVLIAWRKFLDLPVSLDSVIEVEL